MSIANVRFKLIHPNAKMPSYATTGSAGADVCAVEKVVVPPRHWALVKTGLQVELETGWEIQVRSKSGLALKEGLFVLNSPGTVDADYRGEIGVILCNMSDNAYHVEPGQKVAQLVVSPVTEAIFHRVEDVSGTTRGEGGFGSTGL